ncbi:MAG: hypothetical protein K2O67_03440, partial [Clostridia bacterium]|nr:hypothetical protein [Clostridia bacterium]
MYAVGGTASRLAIIKNNLKSYEPSVLHGTVLTREEVRAYAEKLTAMTVEEIQASTIIKKSADVIGGGAALLWAVMNYFNVPRITVSESDNLEGYVLSILN